MAKVIATVKLAPGKVAFYDEYSKIHLTLSNPIAYIYEGMDLRRIRMSVKSGTLRVLSGSLTEPVVTEVKIKTPVVTASAKPSAEKTVIADVVIEEKKEPVVEEPAPAVEPEVEAAPQEEVVPEKKTTKRTKKSAAKETESADAAQEEPAQE